MGKWRQEGNMGVGEKEVGGQGKRKGGGEGERARSCESRGSLLPDLRGGGIDALVTFPQKLVEIQFIY